MSHFNLERRELDHGDGKKTFYLSAGPEDGPLIIFVHGWPGISSFWKPQLQTFSALGFRTVAPDMPGYGRSSARRIATDYSMEAVNEVMLSLLEHIGRDEAIWIGHDWGCAAVWSFASHHPSKCIAVAGLAVPYRTLEAGLEKLIDTVDRNLYPADKYPYGQWSYQKYYELELDKASAWFDQDPEAVLRKLFVRGSPKTYGLPTPQARVTEDGGWFGGSPKPDPSWRKIPVSKLALDQETLDELVAAMKRTGFWSADAWYYNHQRNRAYMLERSQDGGYLRMPVLFIQAKWDAISNAENPKMCAEMRKYCKNLTQCTIEAGHWVAEEKPRETSAAITRWLVDTCPQHWPGYWTSNRVKAVL